jgi:hypothetical protein
MSADMPCPACAVPGRLVGRDAKGRELFTCVVEECDIVEYDRDIIHHRRGATIEPPSHERPPIVRRPRGRPRWRIPRDA